MLSNPIYTISNSGLLIPGPFYSLTVTSMGNGVVSSDALIGNNGYTTNLYAIPNAGYRLSGFETNYGTVTNNSYTFSNNDAIVSAYFEEQAGPTPHYFTLMTAGDEYGWQLPIDVLLNAAENGLYIDISFYTSESDDTSWEGGYYMANPDNTGDYKQWVGWEVSPTVVSPGYRECTVTNTMLVDGLTEGNIDWLNNLKNDGYTYVFTHPAAFQPYKFTSDPTATFWYIS